MGLGFLVLGAPATGQAAASEETIRAYIVHHGVPAIYRLLADFEQETAIHVDATIECRSKLFQIVSDGKDGDVCITDGEENIALLREKGLSRTPAVRLGEITPVIQVVRGNPKKIASVADLARPGVRAALARKGSCLGDVCDKILQKANLTDKVAPNIVDRSGGERATARSVDGNKVDASITWTWTVIEIAPKRFDTIPIPEEHTVVDPLAAVFLETGKNRAGAEKFVAFLRTPRAKRVLLEAGLMAKGD